MNNDLSCSKSSVSSVSGNDVFSKINTLNTALTPSEITVTAGSNLASGHIYVTKTGNIVMVKGKDIILNDTGNLLQVATDLSVPLHRPFGAIVFSSTLQGSCYVSDSGVLNIHTSAAAGALHNFSFMYLSNEWFIKVIFNRLIKNNS